MGKAAEKGERLKREKPSDIACLRVECRALRNLKKFPTTTMG
jgi:hypothetical protein